MRRAGLLPPVDSDEGTAEAIYENLGREASIWLLVLAEKGNVGKGPADNYNNYVGKIQAYAGEGGINLEDDKIRQGFKRLKRVEVKLPTGSSNTILINDDRQDYIKLTSVGYTLQTQLQTRPEIRKCLRQKIGMDVDGDKKENDQLWPSEIDREDREIEIYVNSDIPEDTSESFRLDVTGRFECGRNWCSNTVEHSYSFVYPDQAWSKEVKAECGECSTKWKYKPGYVYEHESPDIVE